MSDDRDSRSRVTISHDSTPAETLVVGFTEFGLAGLTAVEYLVDHYDMTESGHLSVESLPAITPFENGVPRHHTRLFGGGPDLTVLVGELFVPVQAADDVASSLLSWADDNGIEEVVVLSGVPFAHGPDDHAPYYVATPDFREARLADTDLRPMGNGFLEGVNAELMQTGLDSDLRVGMVTTPTHPQAPDVEAALRLLNAFRDVYDIEFDTAPLETFAAEVHQHYSELAQRIQRAEEEAIPDDRMYM